MIHWTVIDGPKLSNYGSQLYEVQCDCGTTKWVQANVSKHTMTMDELYQFCKDVLNHANQQPSQPLTKLEGSETND